MSVEAPLGMSMEMLTFDTNLGGYRTDITEQQIRGAPAFSRVSRSISITISPPDDVLAQIQDRRTTLGNGTAFSAVAPSQQPALAARRSNTRSGIAPRPE